MNIIRVYARGMKEASRRPTMIALLWLANIVLAAPAYFLFSGALGAAVGKSAAPLDQDAMIEFLTGSSGAIRGIIRRPSSPPSSFPPSSRSSCSGGSCTPLSGAVGQGRGPDRPSSRAAGATTAASSASPSIRSSSGFPPWSLFIPVHILATAVMKDSTNEQLGFVLTILRVVLALFLVYFIKMIMDYARIRIVREDTNRVYDSLAWAVRFVFGRLGGTLLLYALLGVTGLAMLAAYLGLNRLFPGSTTGAIVSVFLLSQLFVAGRGWLKIAFQAAELELSSRA